MITLLTVFVLVAGAGAGLYLWASKDLPGFKKISDYNPPLVTRVLAKDGRALGYFYKDKRFLSTLDQMSPWTSKAFLAAEDYKFYEHEGIDLIGIARAAMKNALAGEIVQGGSTITQQVIKSLLLSPERSYTRKLKEAILAYRLEKHLDKDEILTIYLNQIYLGSGAYGVEAAAREYFGKHASELSLAEAALIGGLPKAPSRYNPYKNPKGAKKRREYVLKRLLETEQITEEEFEEANATPIELKKMADPSWQQGAYYLEEVRRRLLEKYGEEKVYTSGMTVHTAADMEHLVAAKNAVRAGLRASTKRRGWQGPIKNLPQEKWQGYLEGYPIHPDILVADEWLQVLVVGVQKDVAQVRFGTFKGEISVESMGWARQPDPEKAPEDASKIKDARKVLQKGDVVWASIAERPDTGETWTLALEQKPRVQGALLSIDPKTGYVPAIVGGYNFFDSQFNRATQAKRQPGSAFKPIVYSAALDNGFSPASIVLDAPIVYSSEEESWKPENFEGMFYGPTLLRTALVKSRNLVTIRLAQRMGTKKIINRAKDLGLKEKFPRDLSVSLGSVPVTLLELCRAYTAFARDGDYVRPRLIKKIENAWGETVFEAEKKTKEAISPQTSYIITNLLQQVVQSGTGWRARELGRPVAGKTGTTNQEQDAWYMGYSPQLLTGVYVGFDQLTPMGKYETGSRAACPIWLKYRQSVEDNYPVQDFKRPSGIVMARVDASTGLLAGKDSKKSFLLPFKEGTQPTVRASSEKGELDEEQAEENLLKQKF
ncbi:MAG: penicillin-binding protein 1A [Desulfonatronovibrionaceae bacterium]